MMKSIGWRIPEGDAYPFRRQEAAGASALVFEETLEFVFPKPGGLCTVPDPVSIAL